MAVGSGEGTPVSPPIVSLSPVYRPTFEFRNTAVSLADYAYIIQYDEPAFWGVYYDDQPKFECTNLWTEYMRNNVSRALAHAQEMIEDYLKHFLADTWVVGTLGEAEPYNPFRLVDEGNYVTPYVARYGRVQEFGVRVEEVLGNFSVSHITDPAQVGFAGVEVGGPSEIKVFLPGTEREIQPSKVTVVGDEVTIEIPRVRLLREELLWKTGDGQPEVRYEIVNNFADAVEVRQVYTDPSTQAKLVTNHKCGVACASSGCQQFTIDACANIRDASNGIVEIQPGKFENGSWRVDRTLFCGADYNRVRLYYKSGLPSLSINVQEAVVRLAHSLMADEPCGCAITQRLWKRDRNIPEYVTRQRASNPFGVSDGAWWAYEQVRNFRFRLKMGVI